MRGGLNFHKHGSLLNHVDVLSTDYFVPHHKTPQTSCHASDAHFYWPIQKIWVVTKARLRTVSLAQWLRKGFKSINCQRVRGVGPLICLPQDRLRAPHSSSKHTTVFPQPFPSTLYPRVEVLKPLEKVLTSISSTALNQHKHAHTSHKQPHALKSSHTVLIPISLVVCVSKLFESLTSGITSSIIQTSLLRERVSFISSDVHFVHLDSSRQFCKKWKSNPFDVLSHGFKERY